MGINAGPVGAASIDNETIGARLQSARRALGLTQTDVGQSMKMVTSTVSAIEAGKRPVSGTELYGFAQIYGRPVAYFLGDEAGEAVGGFQYLFRAVADRLYERRPLVELEQLAADYDLLEELTGAPSLAMPIDYSGFGFRTDQDAETLAEMERARLGLGDAPIADLMDLLDGTVGIRTFLIPVRQDNWSSVSVQGRNRRPCIAVNSIEPGYRRQYDLAHEYGHVLVHLFRKDGPPAHVEVGAATSRVSADERFADAFASALLMPRRAVLGHLGRVLRANTGRFTDFDLVHLAMHFGVNGQAITNRLVSLRKLSRDVYQDYWIKGGQRFNAMAELLGYNVDDPPGFWELPVVLSTRFRYLAMKAYEDDEISLAKLAELLREDYYELRAKVQETVGATRE
jgi:Zn-dependent peptidase ImmA (M78 family)/transcriptional regulator with XRE-family HTH domain